MDWLRSRYSTAIDVLTTKRTLYIGSIGAACAFAGTWLPQIEWNGRRIFDIPTWALWVIVALAALLLIAFDYCHRQRVALEPKINTSFDQYDTGVVQSPVVYKDDKDKLLYETTATYVRIKVEASSVAVKECWAFLTRIEKLVSGRFVSIPLPNALPLTTPVIYVPAKVPRTIDFLQSLASNNQLTLAGSWPLTLRNAFDQHTTYRSKIAVVAEHVTSDICVDVMWAGKWDAITAIQHFPGDKKVT